MMELLAKITSLAIKYKIISYKDLYFLDEECLFLKLKNSSFKKIHDLLKKFETITMEEIPTIKIKAIKKRIINPLLNGVRYKKITNK